MIRAARPLLGAGITLAIVGSACIDTTTGPFVAGLEIIASDTAVLTGHSLTFTVRAWDIERRPVTPRRVFWASADPTRLTVDSLGTARALPGTPGGDVALWASAGPGQGSDTVVIHVAVPGEVKWRLSLGPMLDIGGPAEGLDGTVYVLTYTDPAAQVLTLHAVSTRGDVLWRKVVTGTVENAPIVGPDGTIFVLGQHLWAFTPQGATLWASAARPLDPLSYLHFAAAGNDGAVYGALASDLIAVRGSNGDTIWQGPVDANGAWLPPPTISADGKSVYVKKTGDSAYAFAAATGAVQWQVADPAEGQEIFGAGVAASQGILVIPTRQWLLTVDTLGNALDLSPNHGCCPSEPAIGPDGTLYVQIAGSGVWAYNPVSVVRWGFRGANPARGWYGGPALAADSVLYAAARDGFYALQLGPTGATVRWRFPADTSQRLKFYGAPLIGRDGTVYSFTSTVGGTDPTDATDELFAFWGDKPVEPNSPWPMWRHDARRSGQAHR